MNFALRGALDVLRSVDKSGESFSCFGIGNVEIAISVCGGKITTYFAFYSLEAEIRADIVGTSHQNVGSATAVIASESACIDI